MSKAQIHVAIAIILQQQQVLVGWRESHQHQGNQYEFPGGKVEAGETPAQACRREVLEEVGVDIATWHPFDLIRHEYEDVIVHLHIFHASLSPQNQTELQAPWRWYKREELGDLNFPKANASIIKRLYWPKSIKISDDLSHLNQLQADQWLYWRRDFSPEQVIELAQYSIEDVSKLIINIDLWSALGTLQRQAIAAIHLKQQQLQRFNPTDLKVGQRYMAACHDAASLALAQQLGCDAVFLSPVLATPTHAEQPALGWEGFAALASQLEIPVFALGGLSMDELQTARSYGAYGIAGIRHI